MKDKPENVNAAQGRRPSTGRISIIAAAVLALIQACLTVEGMGIQGFVLWVVILFVGYWLLFTVLIWVWHRLRDHS